MDNFFSFTFETGVTGLKRAILLPYLLNARMTSVGQHAKEKSRLEDGSQEKASQGRSMSSQRLPLRSKL